MRRTAITFGALAGLHGQFARAEPSYGTLLGCPTTADSPCQWAGRDGRAVSADAMMRQMMADEQLSLRGDRPAWRRLEAHVQYLEEVQRHALTVGLEFSYSTGVSARHLYQHPERKLSAHEFVEQEQRAFHRRRLAQQEQSDRETDRRLESIPESLNWCSSDNPRNSSACTTVKSQQECGSCWAFAAADTIEAAVAINSGTVAQALSPQQFLACSTSAMVATFTYCWVGSGVDGASWLQSTMAWGSDNNGCDGGMTHAAFADAALQNWSLLTELDLPYEEEEGSQEYVAVCQNVSSSKAAATIDGWEQAVGPSCNSSSDPSTLLRLALQQQPLSAAINSQGSFKDYKGGIYSCENDGDLDSSSDVDHSIVLVGYGSNGTTDYWILKNSYGSSWGEKGFMRLAADSKANCGLNIFPVIPTGAKATSYHTEVDGGGAVEFNGYSPATWVAIAVAITFGTILLTVAGVCCARRRRLAMQLVKE